MLTETHTKARSLADLPPVESDSLLILIALANADPRPDKIDVGVGVFRDGAGRTPVLELIKKAEGILQATQESKGYLGRAGDKRFAELIRPVLLGEHADDERIAGVQTPGGCGALRLGFELIATVNPRARVFLGTPSWPNHGPIIRAVGLECVEYPYYERGQATVHIVLEDPQLRADWLIELTAMRDRINSVRRRIAAADRRLSFIGGQHGMFSMLPLSKEQVLKLREDHSIYMADSGRFNVVGMGDHQIDRFIAAVVEALDA